VKNLFLIPARGGSKGIPGKNIKNLAGKPLLQYSIELARHFAPDEDIMLSTDDNEIAACAETLHLKTPYRRPAEFAADNSGSYEVIIDALDYCEKNGRSYDSLTIDACFLGR